MVAKVHVKKNDTVVVLSGKDKDKQGKVLEVFPSKGRAVVEGINIIKKHSRPTPTNPQGGITEKPAPLPVSKLMVVCPSCGRPTRVGHRRDEHGAARVCKRCERTID